MLTVTAKNVIDKVWQDYAKAYATATAHSSNIPAEVNGLLTAALKEIAGGNYQKAKNIVGTATDFCYGVSITAVWSDIESGMKAIKRECGQVPQSLESKYNSLKRQKRDLGGKSHGGLTSPPHSSDSEDIFVNCASLRDSVLSEFNMTPERTIHIKTAGRWRISKYLLAGPPVGWLLGLLCSAYSKEIQRVLSGLF